MQIVLRHLAELPVTDPAHRYLLVEVADECRHSTMFGEYIRRADTPAYAPVSRRRARRRRLAARRTGDGLPPHPRGRGAARHVQPGDDARRAHPSRVAPDREAARARRGSPRQLRQDVPHRALADACRPTNERPPRRSHPIAVAFVAELMVNDDVYETLGIAERCRHRPGEPPPPGPHRRRPRQAHRLPHRARRDRRAAAGPSGSSAGSPPSGPTFPSGVRFRAVSTLLDWYGCATFRLRTAGLTIFLDAYIDRAPTAAGAGRSAADISECDWIVVGHSHFDHLFGAETILANTSATLIGSYETVRVLEAAGVDARPDALRGRRRDGRPRQRRARHRLSEPAQLRVVAPGHAPGRRGVPRRPRRDAAGATRPDGGAGHVHDHRARPGRDRAPARVAERAQSARRRRRAALPLRDTRGQSALPGHEWPLDRHRRPVATRRGDRGRGRTGQRRRRTDPGCPGGVRRRSRRPAPAAHGRALPPRRLAPGILRRHRCRADPCRHRPACAGRGAPRARLRRRHRRSSDP